MLKLKAKNVNYKGEEYVKLSTTNLGKASEEELIMAINHLIRYYLDNYDTDINTFMKETKEFQKSLAKQNKEESQWI